MKYTFKAAKKEEIPEIFSLYLERIQWMIKESVGKNGFCKQYFEKISCLLLSLLHRSLYPLPDSLNLSRT